jgi:type VI secretion system protein ImpL
LTAIAFVLVGIWALGPHWTWRGDHPLAGLGMRIAASLAVILMATLAWVFVMWRRNRRHERDQATAAADAADPCGRHVQAQERLLDEHLSALREHADGPRFLYAVPWYLVLGQENAGKTSFVNRSNQHFALTGTLKARAHRPVRDEALAYPIDWWIGDSAVLIDPPGELISQSGAPEDPSSGQDAATVPAAHDGGRGRDEAAVTAETHRRLWLSLVDWLARHRSRRPLNGVVLILDLAALLTQAASDRVALGILLRTRLAELAAQLGTRLPIYIVLTKIDLLDGFEACFARLPRAVREDILGFTFTLDSVGDFDAWQDELANAYDSMLARLSAWTFDAMGDAEETAARESLFSLGHQLAGIRTVLFSFLASIVGSDRYGTSALVRGVYFSSVYQQGLVTNAFVAAAAKSYAIRGAVPAAKPEGRSLVYFAQRLFQQVIYPEAGLAGDNLKVVTHKRRLLWANAATAVLGCLLVLAGWQYNFNVNWVQAENVLTKSRAFSAQNIDDRMDATGGNLVVPLDQIREAVSVYGTYRDAWPWVADMGLYQGRVIGPTVDKAYLRLLSHRFLPSLASGVFDAMNTAPEGSDQQLAALRVYRMIEDRKNRRPALVVAWMTQQWQQAYPAEGAVQASLKRHLDYAMTYADADLPQYRARVAEVQTQLREIPLQQRVYATMKRDANNQFAAPLDLRNEIGPVFDVVYRLPAAPTLASAHAGAHETGTTIDTLLTARGYRDYFVPRGTGLADLAMIDEWVLGERRQLDYSAEDRRALAERIGSMYTAEYIDRWRGLLNRLSVTRFDDIGQAVHVLEAVTGPTAPLRRLLETVRDNTNIGPASVGGAGEAVGATTLPPETLRDNELTTHIARAFAPLNGMLVAHGDTSSYLDQTMVVVGNLYEFMKTVQDAPDRGKAALKAVLDRFALTGEDPIGNLRRLATGLPEPLNRQVQQLADQSAKVLMIEALRELEKRWDADVYAFYSQRIDGRYPFNPAGRSDVSLDDFEAFFGPQGRLTLFNSQYLKVFLTDNPQPTDAADRPSDLLRPDVVAQLATAEIIRNAFFNSRGALNVQFTVEPLGLTSDRRSSVLNIDGQLIPYSHGPSAPVGLMWPNTLGQGGGSKITLVSTNGTSNSLVYPGPWSLFRLLSQGHLAGTTPVTVDLSFQAGAGAMRYRVSAEKANNPFTQRSFSGFTLPRTLLQTERAN